MVPENFYVWLNTLEKRDGHQNVWPPVMESLLESSCSIVDIFARSLASWWDRLTLRVGEILVGVMYIISWSRIVSTECAFATVSVCPYGWTQKTTQS